MDPALAEEIFRVKDQMAFREAALKVFSFQSENCQVYRDYITTLGADPGGILEPEEIPFLPVEFFRTHKVLCIGQEAEVVFESSGTTQTGPSRHYIADLSLYRRSLTETFKQFYGNPEEYCILALLPSYLERGGSSLVHMMDHLVTLSGHPDSGFYLEELEALSGILQKRNGDRHPTLLVGVSFALLDLAEKYPVQLESNIIMMETGGMKGRRKELIRNDLHGQLKEAFGLKQIHSEYGMTEMLSQAYSGGEGIFRAPSRMKVMVRDPNDPLTLFGHGQSGGLNIMDLANIHSCAFIATGDLGRVYEDGSFEVLGRFDHSDVRGCNLLVN